MAAGLLGAAASLGLAYAEAAAIAAKSREYEMGGIPILFAALGFIPFVAGLVAALAAPARPYLAAAIGWGALAVAGIVVTSAPGPDHPVESYLFFPVIIGLPFALWGGLLGDANAGRLRPLRDASVLFALAMTFFALIPIADHFLPGKTAWIFLGGAAGFYVWLALHHRRASRGRPS